MPCIRRVWEKHRFLGGMPWYPSERCKSIRNMGAFTFEKEGVWMSYSETLGCGITTIFDCLSF